MKDACCTSWLSASCTPNVRRRCLSSTKASTSTVATVSTYLVGQEVIVELKAVARIEPIHEAQLLSYLKLSGRHIGLLINFNVKQLTMGIRRLVHELPE